LKLLGGSRPIAGLMQSQMCVGADFRSSRPPGGNHTHTIDRRRALPMHTKHGQGPVGSWALSMGMSRSSASVV
jgi:hypothetical protein